MLPKDFRPPNDEVTRAVQAWLCALTMFLLGVLSATGVMVLR